MKDENLNKKIALFINPSYDTSIQTMFSDNIKKTLNDIGFLAVTLCNRKVVEDKYTLKIEKQRLSSYTERVFYEFPAWLPQHVAESYLDQELIFRNEDRIKYSACIRNGLLYCSNIIDIAFKELSPAITFLENKVYFFTSMGYLAAKHYGSKTYVTEKSPLMNIWVEENGFFSETALPNCFQKRDASNDEYYSAIGKQVAKAEQGNAQGFRSINYAVQHTEDFLSNAQKPIFFFPFDNAHGTGLTANNHPQTLQDYPGLNIKSIIEKTIQTVESLGGELVIKSHPSYKIGETFPEYANYLYDSFDLELMLNNADVVVGMLSKTLFHALLYKKQTVSITSSALSNLGFTYTVDTVGDWLPAFSQALEASRNIAKDPESIFLAHQSYDTYLKFLGWAYIDFFYDYDNQPNFCRKNIYMLTNSLSQYKFRDTNKAELEQSILKIRNILYDIPTSKKKVIYFDVSRLQNKSFNHTGISVFIKQFLDSFSKEGEFTIIPTLSGSQLNHRNDYSSLQEFEKEIGYKVQPLPLPTPNYSKAEQFIYFSPQDGLPNPATTPNHMRILCVHDIFLYNVNGYPTSIAAREGFRNVIQSLDVKRDFILCSSEFTKESLLNTFPFINENQVLVCYLALTEGYFSPSEMILESLLTTHNLTKRNYIALLYQNNHRKNWNTIFALLGKILLKKQFEGDIAIVCNKSTQVQLTPILQKFFFDDLTKIRFILSPEIEQLASLYNGALFTIYPSLYEGFGFPVLEAMASGCPVIAHNGSSIKEIAETAALLVDMTSPEAIEHAIGTMIQSSELRSHFASCGRSQAQKFTRENINKKYIEAFDAFWPKYLTMSKFYHQIKPYTDSSPKATPPAPTKAAPATPALAHKPEVKRIDLEHRFKNSSTWKQALALFLLDHDRLKTNIKRIIKKHSQK